jgi:predicted Rossmann fold nucleotide-binding protein DprA/Smf involved in DNA uptake
LASTLRRQDPELESVARVVRSDGFSHEAVVLDTPGVLSWAEAMMDAGKVITAMAPEYPSRWLRALSSAAPPALWRSGPLSDPERRAGAIAVVGSRHISTAVRRFAREVGQAAATHGMSLYSGNAVGCDEEAMRGAASQGGRVVGILPHGIERLGRRVPGAEYWSVCSPDEEFSRATAMERNVLIYASAASTVVVHSRFREGGTWHGAIEAHRRKLTRLVARQDERDAGNRALIALGAIPLGRADELLGALESDGGQPFLFD